MANGGIELVGVDQLLKALDGASESVKEAALQGLEQAGSNIVIDAVRNVKNNHSWVTGGLANSGRVERKKDEVTAGFFDTKAEHSSGYAVYYEFGRRSGRMPPPEDLAAWAYKKFQLKDKKLATSMGWAYAKTIARRGTQPHPFFVPAVNKNTKGTGIGSVTSTVAEAIRKVLRKSTASFALEGRRIKNTPVTTD